MIASYEQRCIFLKTRKTAGTSVEIALSGHCGPRDIITSISPADEVTRSRLAYPGSQNCKIPLPRMTMRQWARLVARHRRSTAYNHMPAHEVRRLVGSQMWHESFRFTLERNPWDAAVSFYFWLYRDCSPRPALNDYLRSGHLELLRRNGDIYRLDGKVAVHQICRFESLADDLEQVRARLGLPEPLALPHAKSGIRKDRRSYRELMTEADAALVGRLFAREIEELGYAF